MMQRTGVFLAVCILVLAGFAGTLSVAGPAQQPMIIPDPSIVHMMQQINESLVSYYNTHLTSFGARYTGSQNCTLASQYIYNEFQAMGLAVEYQNWQYDTFSSRNVVATLPGKNVSSNATFIMSAHYDTVPNAPGADDDGSGVAAVLATAKIMSHYSFNYTIRFICFSGEEVGGYGSYSYAHDASRRGDNIVAVINPDMVGYANTTVGGRILRFYYPERSKWIADFATTVSKLYINQTNLSIESLPNYIGADHQAFVDYGYDGVWIAHHDGYPWGHSRNDTSDRLNWTYLVKATKLLLAVMAEYASTPLDLQIFITRPYQGYFYFFNQPLLQLNLGKDWYKGLRGTTIILGRANFTVDVITNEPIKFIIFCIDGNFMQWNTGPPYVWKIQGMHYPPIGRHTIKVYAYTQSGKVATDEMNIIIFTLACQFHKQKK